MQEIKNFNTFLKCFDAGMESLIAGRFEESKRQLDSSAETLFDLATREGNYSREFSLLSKHLYEHVEKMEDVLDSRSAVSERIAKGAVQDISRNPEVIREINRLILYPEAYPELYRAFGKKKNGGILLYGVPGTGKTRIVKQLAKVIDARFIEIKCSDVISKWFGESEGNISKVFREARQYPKSIIFFDEFEAIGAKRSDESIGPMNRVISELLSQLQGFADYENQPIVIAATNRPWSIDSAFLRPGRFASSIHIPLPDSSDREIIAGEELEGIPLEGFTHKDIAEATGGFNCADVVEFCEKLKDNAIERCIRCSSSPSITKEDFENAVPSMKSSVKAEDAKRIAEYAGH